MKKYTVFSLSVANKLIEKGYKLIGTGINLQHPQYKVFYFEDTPEVRAAIADITA